MPIAANGTWRGDTSPLSSRAHSIDPMPTPIANTVRSSVATLPLPCSTSRTIVGNSVSRVAPTTQNHARPRIDSQIGRIEAACRTMRHV